jgi:hypothetical protein
MEFVRALFDFFGGAFLHDGDAWRLLPKEDCVDCVDDFAVPIGLPLDPQRLLAGDDEGAGTKEPADRVQVINDH